MISPCDLDVLYEDNHILVVNKPSGLLSQPTEQESDSLETRVKTWIKEKYHKPGNVFVGVVHRLDKPVSGIVLFAKTSKALSRLNDSIRLHKMQKIYLAWVEGVPKEKKGTLIHFLKQGDHCSLLASSRDPDAKQAILHYEVIQESLNTALLQIILATGRYHQIRCQCAAMGHPIVGDIRYGAKQRTDGQEGIALHHTKLTFPHPITHETMCIEAPF